MKRVTCGEAVSILGKSSESSSDLPMSSLSSSNSTGLTQRAADPTPSTHFNMSTLTSLTLRLRDRQQTVVSRLLLEFRASTPRCAILDFSRVPSRVVSNFSGRADSRRGFEGRCSGSIYRESNNSPRTFGGFNGSHVDLGFPLSNSMSTWPFGVSEDDKVDTDGEGP